MYSMRSSKCKRLICDLMSGEDGGIQRAARTSFSLSNPEPSLKSNTMLQSLSLRMSTGVLSPETSLNMGVGVRNSGGSGPERALNSFIQNLPSNTKRPNRAALMCNYVTLQIGTVIYFSRHRCFPSAPALPPGARPANKCGCGERLAACVESVMRGLRIYWIWVQKVIKFEGHPSRWTQWDCGRAGGTCGSGAIRWIGSECE